MFNDPTTLLPLLSGFVALCTLMYSIKKATPNTQTFIHLLWAFAGIVILSISYMVGLRNGYDDVTSDSINEAQSFDYMLPSIQRTCLPAPEIPDFMFPPDKSADIKRSTLFEVCFRPNPQAINQNDLDQLLDAGVETQYDPPKTYKF